MILTPTNAAAGRINLAYLNALQSVPHTYKAATKGEFNTSAAPTETDLTLKAGAKVILLRNDPDKRWVNGTVARIAKLTAKQVWIEINGVEYEVEPVAWENRRYAYDTAEQTHRRNGRWHVHAVSAAAGLGPDDPQVAGPDARQGLYRPDRRHLRARPGVRGACPVAARSKASR